MIENGASQGFVAERAFHGHKMKRFKNLISWHGLLTLGLLFGLLLEVGCSKKRPEPKEVKIGAILPLTGDGAKYGQSAKKGIDLAVEEINAFS